MPLARGIRPCEQGAADLQEFLAAGDGAVEAAGAGEDRKSRYLTLSVTVRPVISFSAIRRQTVWLIRSSSATSARLVGQVLEEGVLGADRFPGPVGLDLAVADAAGEVVIIVAAEPKLWARKARLCARRSAPVTMPRRAIFSAVLGPMPWKRLTGSGGDERLALGRRHHAQAVGLVLVARPAWRGTCCRRPRPRR